VPAWLESPIPALGVPAYARPPAAYITPHLAAQPEVSLEWTGAGWLDPLPSAGTMQRGHTAIRRLYYGYNPASLFLRLELNEPLAPHQVAFYLAVPGREKTNRRVRFADTNPFLTPGDTGWTWEILVRPGQHDATLHRADGQEVWRPAATVTSVAAGERTVEIAASLKGLGLELGSTAGLLVTLARDDQLIEALPTADTLSFPLKAMT